jgi:hypothetical protein
MGFFLDGIYIKIGSPQRTTNVTIEEDKAEAQRVNLETKEVSPLRLCLTGRCCIMSQLSDPIH